MRDAVFLILYWAFTDAFRTAWLRSAMNKQRVVPRGSLVLFSVTYGSLLYCLLAALGSGVTVLILAGVSLGYFAHLLHIRFFGAPIATSQIRQMRRGNQKVLGTAMKHLIKRSDLSLLLLWGTDAAFAWAFTRLYPDRPLLLSAGGTVLLLVGSLLLLFAWRNRAMSREDLFERGGVWGMLVESNKLQVPHELGSFMGEHAQRTQRENEATRRSPLFGTATGKNLLFIQLESFQQFLLDANQNGQPVAPFLRKLRAESLSFDQIYAQYGLGHTADVELVTLNSLYPSRKEIYNFTRVQNQFEALPKLLKKHGYVSAGFHGHTGEYYNRRMMFKSYGFDHFFAEEDFATSEVIGLGLADEPFFVQSVEKLKGLPQPFFGHVISLTSHFPFEMPGAAKSANMLDRYFDAVRYTDRALEELFRKLYETGLLNNTVVVLYGDHEGVPLENVPELVQYLKLPEGRMTFHAAEVRKVPLIIYDGVTKGALCSTLGSTMDIAPTVLSLFGIEKNTAQFGSNLLIKDEAFVALTSYPAGSFVSERYLYLASESGEFADGTLMDRNTGLPPRGGQHPQAQAWFQRARDELNASELLVARDAIHPTDPQEQPTWELQEDLQACLPEMKKGSVLLPYTYSFEQIQKEADQLLAAPDWYEPLWARFEQQTGLRLSYFSKLDLEQNERDVYFKDSTFMPFFRGADYEIDVVRGRTIVEWLDAVPQGSLLFLAARDEASGALPSILDALEARGLPRLRETKVRWSYLGVLQKSDAWTTIYEATGDEALSWQGTRGRLPVEVALHSAGALHGNAASILVAGKEYSKHQRGLNIVVYDLKERRVTQSVHFDTFTTIYEERTVYVARRKVGIEEG